jgi:hypothetical protein
VTGSGALWSKDVSEDIAREIMRRFGLAGDELPSSLEAFVDEHLSPDAYISRVMGTPAGLRGLLRMPYRTRIISGCLEFETFLVVGIAEVWLLFALALDRLCSALERDSQFRPENPT